MDRNEIERLLHSLTPSQIAYVQRVAQGKALWAPQSRIQWQALLSPADELFYGGQAGGGKTDLVLGCAITEQRDSVVFRREYRQMTGAQGIIDRSRELLGNVANYNGQEHVWRDIPGGRSLEFGSLQYEPDKYRWMGRPHDFIAFDEITEFTKSQYEFVIRWNRTTDETQRCRVLATGNPPMHPEGRWVIDYWAPWLDDRYDNPALPGELRWFAMVDGESVEIDGPEPFDHKDEHIVPRSRTFLPASLQDNPYLGAEYRAVIAAAPEPLRSQLLYGDFSVGLADQEWQVIPTDWVRQAQARWTTNHHDEQCDTVGVDASRGGTDEFTICKRHGEWFSPIIVHPARAAPDGEAGAMLIASALFDEPAKPDVCIDVIGIGSSVYDHAKKIMENVYPVNFAEGSRAFDKTGKYKMRNVRAEAFWTLREALDPTSGEALALPPDSRLLADLTAPTYKVTASGILIEAKQNIKERLGRSPDRGEALVLAWYGKAIAGPWALLI